MRLITAAERRPARAEPTKSRLPLLEKYFHNRKSWLFSDSVAAAIIYSLMLTCHACGLEPYGYLLKVLTDLPQRAADDDISDLLLFSLAKRKR
jgi:hypothetical protein